MCACIKEGTCRLHTYSPSPFRKDTCHSVTRYLLAVAVDVSRSSFHIYIYLYTEPVRHVTTPPLTSIPSLVEIYLSLLAGQVSRSDLPLYIPGTSHNLHKLTSITSPPCLSNAASSKAYHSANQIASPTKQPPQQPHPTSNPPRTKATTSKKLGSYPDGNLPATAFSNPIRSVPLPPFYPFRAIPRSYPRASQL